MVLFSRVVYRLLLLALLLTTAHGGMLLFFSPLWNAQSTNASLTARITGTGKAGEKASVEILWPSVVKQVINYVRADQFLPVREPEHS